MSASFKPNCALWTWLSLFYKYTKGARHAGQFFQWWTLPTCMLHWHHTSGNVSVQSMPWVWYVKLNFVKFYLFVLSGWYDHEIVNMQFPRELNHSWSGAHLHRKVRSNKVGLGGNCGGLLCQRHQHDHQLLQGVAGVPSVNDHHHPSYHWSSVPRGYSLSPKGIKHCHQPPAWESKQREFHRQRKGKVDQYVKGYFQSGSNQKSCKTDVRTSESWQYSKHSQQANHHAFSWQRYQHDHFEITGIRRQFFYTWVSGFWVYWGLLQSSSPFALWDSFSLWVEGCSRGLWCPCDICADKRWMEFQLGFAATDVPSEVE